LIQDQEELQNKIIDLSPKPILFQKYIQESKGRDIRLCIVGGEFVGAVMRTNNHDFRANVSNGGMMTTYTPTTEEINIAKKACDAIGLDFAGVDILFGNNGPLICEINSNAHMKSFYDATGIDVVKKIFEYIISRGE
jgi:ribosomal protein S6--L-glutamate ligase/gamma-F420-2:alpha-L-glutamate ligase